MDRVDTIKAVWAALEPFAPPNAYDVKPGEVVVFFPDPDDNIDYIFFQMMEYGGKRVVEAEGVVVYRLPEVTSKGNDNT